MLRISRILIATMAASVFLSVTATTHSWAAPAVSSYEPAAGSTVPVTAPVKATFIEAMDPGTLTAGSFTLSKFVGMKGVAAGRYHTVALRKDGTVVAWGNNEDGQSAVPTGLAGVTAVSAGEKHSVALKNDGTVVAWGSNLNGQTTVPAGLTGVTAIAAGYNHTVVLTCNEFRPDGSCISGTVSVWGDNGKGQATAPAVPTGFVAIATGHNHSVAVKNDGTVVAWGDNTYGQRDVPSGLKDVVAVAAGDYHTIALKSDGSLVAWGQGANNTGYKQSTIPDVVNYPNPEDPNGYVSVIAIAAGYGQSVALREDGTVVAWGYNYYGQSTVPSGLTGVAAIAAKNIHTLALKLDGTLVAWGDNNHGQIAIPQKVSGVIAAAGGEFSTVAVRNNGTVAAWGINDYTQTDVPAGLAGVTAVAAGKDHVVALKSNGTVATWGYSVSGLTSIPPVLTGATVTAIAAGHFHSVALKSDGTVVAWGSNGADQTTIPTDPPLTAVTGVAAGSAHTVALKSDGTVVTWGNNDYGQSTVPTVPTSLAGVTAVTAGANHTMALKSDGTVVSWGKNDYGQSSVPAELAGVTAIAAGNRHSVALKSNGTVVTWGDPLNTVPSGLTGVMAIAAGHFHTIAFKSDGTMISWGSNAYGESTSSGISIYETAVPGSPTYDAETLSATFTPATTRLDYGATYTASVTGVRSQSGTPLSAQTEWSFTTAGTILWGSPTSHDFGSVIINTTPSSQTFTVSNTDATSPVTAAISITGPDATSFSVTPDSCESLTPTIAAGGSCTVTVLHIPTSAGSRSATLQIAAPALVNQTFGLPLTGNGVLQSFTLSATVTGTGAGVVQSSPGTDIACAAGICAQPYDLGTVVTLTAAPGSGSSFAGWSGACSGTGDCVVTMKEVRSVAATFTLNPVNAIVAVSPSSLTFSNIMIHTSSTRALTISNSGTAEPLTVLNVSLSGTNAGLFMVTAGTCGSTQPVVAAGKSCVLGVLFQPVEAGDSSAILSVTSNASNSSVVNVPLLGSAFDPPPSGSVTINGGATHSNSLNVTLTLSASDYGGNVAAMRFSNNNVTWSGWEPYVTTASWTLMALGGDGVKTVYVQYIDENDNESGSFFDTITVDVTSPTITITAKPVSPYTGRGGNFGFSANEAVSGFECRLDNGAFASCTTPYSFSGLADGSHSFAVRASDLAGNPATTVTESWIIDATPPETTITSMPAILTTLTSGALTFSSNDPAATFECSLDNAAYSSCSTPQAFNGFSDGSHTFRVRAKDAAGNYDLTPASYSWTIDTAPPETSITYNPANPAAVSSGRFEFSSTETGSTFLCSLDNGDTFTPCLLPYSFSNLSNGVHTFKVKAVDGAGNTDLTPATYSWTVNFTTPQSVKLTGSGLLDSYYATISAALVTAPLTPPLQLRTLAFNFAEDVNLNRCGAIVTMKGSYSSGFTTVTGPTTILGSLTVTCGTLIAENLVLQ